MTTGTPRVAAVGGIRTWEWTILAAPPDLTAFVQAARDDDWREETLIWQDGSATYVAGALARDMALYPFLDIVRQWRRLGVSDRDIRRLTRALARGRAVGARSRGVTVRKAPA
jgi:hypothetical protein